MSLISDALRKARQEAAARDARARGVAPPPGPVSSRSSAGLGTGLIIGAVIAAAAALAGGAAVWWAVGSGGEPDPPRATRAAAEQPPATDPPTGAAPADDVPASRPWPSAGETTAVTGGEADADRPHPDPGARPTETVPTTEPPAPTALPAAPPPAVEPSVPAPSGAAASPPDGDGGPREFGLVADLGYTRLELGYVIYRADDPFAEINGREVHVGTRIGGFVVEEIGRTFVRLSDDRGPVTLRIR